MSEVLNLESINHWGMHPVERSPEPQIFLSPALLGKITAAVLEILDPAGADSPCVVDAAPLARDIVASVCKALGDGVQNATGGEEDARTQRTEVRAQELEEALKRILPRAKPFTMKPVGAPGSRARLDQEDHIVAYSYALKILEQQP